MWLLIGLGCGTKTDDPALRAELAEAREQIAQLRSEVDVLVELSRPTPEAVPDAPAAAAEVGEHTPARRRALEGSAARARQDAVDEDMQVLEEDVDDQALALDDLQLAVDDLTAIVNNHAGLIDLLGEEVEALDSSMGLVRSLEGTMVVQGNEIRIQDADLVMVPGVDEEGRPKTNGRVRVESIPR